MVDIITLILQQKELTLRVAVNFLSFYNMLIGSITLSCIPADDSNEENYLL